MNPRAVYQTQRGLFIHRHRTTLRTRRRAALTVGALALAVVVLAVVARWITRGLPSPALTFALVAVAIAVALALTRPAPPPHAHGLVGYPDDLCDGGERDLGFFVVGSRLAGVAVAVIFAGGLPSGLVLVASGIAVALSAPVLTYRLWVRARTRTLARALAAHGPRFAIAYAGFGGGPTHLTMWEAPLLSAGFPGVVFNYRAKYCNYLRAETDLSSPFIQLSDDAIRDLKHLVVPGLGAFFYLHNAMSNLRYMAIPQVKHVWLGHGDSDKPASVFARHARYDLLVMSGSAAIDRYAHGGVDIPPEKFVVLGRPQVSEIESASGPIELIERPTVLYAPTWQGKNDEVDFSSLTVGADIVRSLIDRGANVMFRPHPLSSRAEKFRPLVQQIDEILAADTASPESDGQHLWGALPNETWSIFDCMNRADALVSDVSSVASDWLQSGKPFAMVSTRWEEADFRERFPVSRAAYVLKGDLANATTMFDDMFGDDSLQAKRRELRETVLGGFEGHGAADAFAAYFHQLFAQFKP